MKQPTYFIEVVKYPAGYVISLRPYPIRTMKLAIYSTVKFGYETIAIFKIYPK